MDLSCSDGWRYLQYTRRLTGTHQSKVKVQRAVPQSLYLLKLYSIVYSLSWHDHTLKMTVTEYSWRTSLEFIYQHKRWVYGGTESTKILPMYKLPWSWSCNGVGGGLILLDASQLLKQSSICKFKLISTPKSCKSQHSTTQVKTCTIQWLFTSSIPFHSWLFNMN